MYVLCVGQHASAGPGSATGDLCRRHHWHWQVQVWGRERGRQGIPGLWRWSARCVLVTAAFVSCSTCLSSLLEIVLCFVLCFMFYLGVRIQLSLSPFTCVTITHLLPVSQSRLWTYTLESLAYWRFYIFTIHLQHLFLIVHTVFTGNVAWNFFA